VKAEGSWLRIQTGIGLQANSKSEFRLQISKPEFTPNYDQGKALIDRYVEGKSTRAQEKKVKLEDITKAKVEADAKAAAELKVKKEEETKKEKIDLVND
jgi:hypothetical protein